MSDPERAGRVKVVDERGAVHLALPTWRMGRVACNEHLRHPSGKIRSIYTPLQSYEGDTTCPACVIALRNDSAE